MPESSDIMCFFIFLPENIYHVLFRIHKILWILFLFGLSPQGPIIWTNDFFTRKIVCTKKITKNFIILLSHHNVGRFLSPFFSFFKDRFFCRMVKKNEVSANFWIQDLQMQFGLQFTLHLQFSLHYHKQWSINNIKVKCLQIGKNVPDVFWICSLQVASRKIEVNADFIILIMWLWFLITTTNFRNVIYIDMPLGKFWS